MSSKKFDDLNPGDIVFIKNLNQNAKIIGKTKNNKSAIVEIQKEGAFSWFNTVENQQCVLGYGIKTELGKHYCWLFDYENFEFVKSTSSYDFKKDIANAGYRVASTQISAAIKNAILLLLKKDGFEDGKLKIVQEILDTPVGDAIISYALGNLMTHFRGLTGQPAAVKLASELRINGLSVAGNYIADALMQYIVPAIKDAAQKVEIQDIKYLDNKKEELIIKEVSNEINY